MSVRADVGYALRALIRAPVFVLVVTATLALGIGVNAGVFTVVDSVLIRKLPYADPDRLMAMRWLPAGVPRVEATVPSPALRAWSSQGSPFVGEAAYLVSESNVQIASAEPTKLPVGTISPDLFGVLRINAVANGRAFTGADAKQGAPGVAIVSDAFWRDQLGGTDNLADARLRVDGRVVAVVGVTAESFQFPDVTSPDILVPLHELPDDVVASVHAIGRLRMGTSVPAANRQLTALTKRIEASFPSAMASFTTGEPGPVLIPLQTQLVGDVRQVLLIALGIAGAILLTACANVAGLLLARINSREREIAIRVAIGATPSRLARLLLVESVILALMGGLAAILAVAYSLRGLRALLSGVAPVARSISIDSTVLAYTVAATVGAGLLCATLPILRVLGRGPLWDLRPGSLSVGRARHTARRVLVVGQVAGAVVLLVGALLLLGTLTRLTTTDLGFDSRQLLTMRVPATGGHWPEPHTATLDETLARIAALPGVVSVAATSALPLDGHLVGFNIAVEGQPEVPPSDLLAGVDLISPTYARVMGIRLIAGRAFTNGDTSTSPRVALVNQSFLRWKQLTIEEAMSRRIGLSTNPMYASTAIVGIVDDVKDGNPGDEPRPIVYKPFTQAAPNIGFTGASFVVRSKASPADLIEPSRQVIRAVMPGAAITDVQPMEKRIARLVAPQRERAVVFGVFGLTAVVLAAVGLYGLVAYIVSEGMREFGIRLALGAKPTAVASIVLRRGLGIASLGLVLGIVAARLAAGVLASFLYGITIADPTTYAVAVSTMFFVAALTSYLPARRAMHADPLAVLRAE